MRYRVDDLPPGKVGAFTPIPAVNNDGSSWGLVDVFGAPGTMAVDTPSPVRGVLPSRTAQASGPNTARGSDNSPDVIFPTIYIASARNMGPWRRLGRNMMRRCPLPVPAVDHLRLANSQPLIVTKGSRVTQPWPRAFQRYPTQGG